MASLKRSIARFGFVEPIVWNETTGFIIGGHQRYTLLVEEGIEEVFAVVVKMEESEGMAANITLNNPNIEGDWDSPILDLLEHLKEKDGELFTQLSFDGLKEAIERRESQTNPPPNQNDDNDGEDDDDIILGGDTTCPCCAHCWDVGEDEISILEIKK